MDNKTYTKLSLLVGGHFTVEAVDDFVFKKWDNDAHKMLTSVNYEEGYRKVYPVTTDKGLLDLGAGQLGNLLEAIQNRGSANLIGETFSVKSNGKSGIDIRYFFNPVKRSSEPKVEEEPLPEFFGDD